MSRLPIRLRVAAAFALAMAVVLAATGWFLYVRLGSHLALALDRDLPAARPGPEARSSASPTARWAPPGERASSSAARAMRSLLDASGRVVDATPPLGVARS